MLTRCPACDTTFRVTPEQLKARQGKVRCGECQHVFNALDTLLEETVVAVPVPVPVPPAAVPADAVPAGNEPEAEAFNAVPPAGRPSGRKRPEEAEPTFAAEPDDQPEPVPQPEPELEPEPVFASELIIEPVISDETPQPDPLLHEFPDEAKPQLRWPWVVGVVAAVPALLLQLAIHFRVELAVVSPEARPALEMLCDAFGCTVDLPSKAELMTIEASDLQPDAEQKGVLKLNATLRNRAPFAQAYPHLELSLTDTENKALARRVLRPADYLPRGMDPTAGLASGEFAFSIPIDSGNVGASGYRLYLFYP